jgi:2-haloacid dehalogenase
MEDRPMPEQAVAFDVMGTLFDLAPLGERLQRLGAPPVALQAWFSRLLHSSTALTLAGEFRPFAELAEAALRTLLAQLDLDEGGAGDVLAGLAELPPYPDARDAIQSLASAGIPMLALTNGGEQNTRTLLKNAGLDALVPEIVTTEDVRVYKPHPAVYRRAVETLGLPAERVTLVAAHAWDVVGARAAGLNGVWVERLERRWPLPVLPVPGAADLRAAAALVLQSRQGSSR